MYARATQNNIRPVYGYAVFDPKSGADSTDPYYTHPVLARATLTQQKIRLGLQNQSLIGLLYASHYAILLRDPKSGADSTDPYYTHPVLARATLTQQKIRLGLQNQSLIGLLYASHYAILLRDPKSGADSTDPYYTHPVLARATLTQQKIRLGLQNQSLIGLLYASHYAILLRDPKSGADSTDPYYTHPVLARATLRQ